MIKRIVSGIFALAALGALGVIIGGALASGEQLIVRFLTAVIVAALALYVVSDLRLKSEPEPGARMAVSQSRQSTQPANGSFTLSPDSTMPTAPMGVDGRDLQPAARTVDVVHPPVQTRSAATGNAGDIDYVGGGDIDGDIDSVGGDDHDGDSDHDSDGDTVTDPVTAAGDDMVDLTPPHPENDDDVASEVGHQPSESDAVYDLETSDSNAVYVAVGTHTYEGNLETRAANWPLRATGDEATIDPTVIEAEEDGAINDDVEIHQVGEEMASVETGFVAAEPESPHDPESTDNRESLNDAVEPLEGAASVPDLVRTTASYAGPVRTPLIDLREPITEDLPAAPASISRTLTSVSTAQATPPPVRPAAKPPTPSVTRSTLSTEVVSSESGGNARGHEQQVAAAIAGGERKVIDTLIRQGMLSTGGPITDRDVRTMVYVAFTSNELRKIILSRGQVNVGSEPMGQVELFDETVFQPVPQTVYTGRPQELAGPPTPTEAGLIPKTRTDEFQDSPV